MHSACADDWLDERTENILLALIVPYILATIQHVENKFPFLTQVFPPSPFPSYPSLSPVSLEADDPARCVVELTGELSVTAAAR